MLRGDAKNALDVPNEVRIAIRTTLHRDKVDLRIAQVPFSSALELQAPDASCINHTCV